MNLLPQTRRGVLALTGAILLTASCAGVASAQDANVYDESALLETGPLADNVLGAEDAPVTIIEYASMTCPHCAAFHENVYPDLKTNYIDTGKVRLVFREFPLDRLAAAAAMVARCVESERFFPFVAVLFSQQKTWVAENPIDPLKKFAKQAGLSDEAFDKCLSNQELLDGIMWIRDRGDKEFDVGGTPSFFVNGRAISARDVPDYAAIAQIIDEELAQ